VWVCADTCVIRIVLVGIMVFFSVVTRTSPVIVVVFGTRLLLADGSQMRMKQEPSEQDQIQHEIH
jgi:hypothetical protein